MKQLSIFLITLITFFSCDKSVDNNKDYGGNNGQGGSMARFTIVGNYLYTVDDENLKVFNVANPAVPVFERSVSVGFEIETIYPFKDKLFIGSTSVVHIFDIADPSNPKKLSEAISPTVLRRCDPVVAKDTVAYATLRSTNECGGVESILAVYDIKDITHPIQRNSYRVSEPYGLGYSGDVLYVCDWNKGLIVFDISEAYNPKYIKSINDGKYIDVIPYGNLLICWTSTGMILYDISNKQNPTLLTQIN